MSDPLFSRFDLSLVIENHIELARKEVDACSEDYLLSVSETDFNMHLVSKVALDVPKLGEPFMLEPKEVDVELSDDPLRDRGTGQIRNVRGCRVEIHVPFTGDRDLFHCRPSTFTYSPPYAQVFEDH